MGDVLLCFFVVCYCCSVVAIVTYFSPFSFLSSEKRMYGRCHTQPRHSNMCYTRLMDDVVIRCRWNKNQDKCVYKHWWYANLIWLLTKCAQHLCCALDTRTCNWQILMGWINLHFRSQWKLYRNYQKDADMKIDVIKVIERDTNNRAIWFETIERMRWAACSVES